MAFNCKLVEITPTQAGKWFEKRADFQRKLNEDQVNKIVMAIQRNEWELNGATVVFNDKDQLIDGQHRLKAIMIAGKCVPSLVVWEVSSKESVFQTIDDAKARKLSDFIHTANANNVGAVLRTYWRLMNGSWPPGGGGGSVGTAPLVDVLKLVKKYGTDVSLMCEPVSLAGRLLHQHSYCVFLLFYHTKIKPLPEPQQIRMAEFFGRVADGLGLTANDPVYRLRSRFFAQSSTGEMKRVAAQAIILKALYLYIDQKPCGNLRFEPDREPFPELRGWTGKLDSQQRIA